MTTAKPARSALLAACALLTTASLASDASARRYRGYRDSPLEAPTARYRGAIDLGSSSAKMVIGDGRGRVFVDIKQGTKLGAGVGRDRLLPAANQQRALSALQRFVGIAGKYGIKPAELKLVSTAAVRNTTGSPDATARAAGKKSGAQFICEDVQGKLGICQARILTGKQEAELGFRGALAAWPKARLDRQRGADVKRVAVIDTGGSSNQTTVGTPGGAITASGSIQIGSHRVRQLMQNGQASKVTYSPAELAAADKRLARKMTRLPVRHALVKGATPVVTGGFGKFLRAHFGRDQVTRAEIEALRVELCAKDLAQRGRFVRKGHGSRRLLPNDSLKALGITTTAAARSYGEGLPAKATLMLRVMKLAGLTQATDSILLSATDTRHALIAD